ncbi:MAG TPA: hypothetical protein VFS31_16135, partial [Chitinophagaceae bacterium]|nr:hypothetical protein [Chitinophagaceae bacterium]
MRFFLTILTAFLFLASNGQEQLQIRETFANNSGSYQTGTNSTYDIYFGVATGSTGSNPGGAMVAPSTGVTTMDSTPVNVTYTTITEKGFLQDAHSSDRKLFFTTTNANKYINQNPISRTGQELSRVKYATANNSTTWVTRFCVLVNGNWYAYGGTGQQQSVVSGNSDGSAFATYTAVWDVAFNMAGANWCPVSYDPDLNLSIDTVNRVVLPAGDVNGYGIYCSRTSASTAQIRFDNIEIYTVPVAQAGVSLAVRETFYNTTGNYRSASVHGWALRQGTTDTLPKSTSINVPYLGSTLTDNTPVNVNYTTVSDSGFLGSAESNTIKLFYT